MARPVSGERHRDRRTGRRRQPHETPWCEVALLRPGQEVRLVNLSSGGALLESPRRMRPGSAAELHLLAPAGRCVLRARILRCSVAALEPLRYRGAIAFEDQLDLDAGTMGRG